MKSEKADQKPAPVKKSPPAKPKTEKEIPQTGEQDAGENSLLRAIFDISPDAVVVIDPHDPDVSWPIIDCNTALCEMNGYKREELIGYSIDVLNGSEGTEAERTAYMNNLRQVGGSIKIEAMHTRRDGTTFPVEVSTMLVTIDGRELVIGIDRDITERMQAEENLIAERNLLSTVIDNLPDNIFVKDINSRLIVDNIAHRRLLGATALEEVVGKTDFDFFSKEIAAPYIADEQKIIQSGESMMNKEEPVVDQDGNQRWLLTTKVPLRDRQGEITGIVGINHDITELKQAQEKLAQERTLLHTLMDNIPDYIYAKDMQGRKVMSNVADWKGSGGKVMEDVLGKTDFDTYPPELAAKFWADDKAVLDSGQPVINREEPALDKDGNPIWLLTTKVPLKDGNGEITGLVGIGRNITLQKQITMETDRQKRYFESLILNSPIAIVMLDNDENIVSSNPAFEKLYGFASEEILGLNLNDLITNEESRQEAVRYTQEATNRTVYAIGTRQRKDGSLVKVEIFGVPVIIDGKRVARSPCITTSPNWIRLVQRQRKPAVPRANSLPI